MNDIFMSLLFAGLLAGALNYFVLFKKLQMPTDKVPNVVMESEGFITKVWIFIKNHWEFFGYLIVGVAGAFLFPLVHELLNLQGLPADLKGCGFKNCLNSWYEKVVFGYGLLFGVFTVRLVYGIFGGILKKVNSLTLEVKELEKKPTVIVTSQNSVTEAHQNLNQETIVLEQVAQFEGLRNVPDWRFFVKGVDVSHHNKEIDWTAIRSAGVEFTYIKITDGVGTSDRLAQENANNAKLHGLKIGYYHFARPDKKVGGSIEADANAEANEVLNIFRLLPPPELPLMIDLEDENGKWETPLNPNQYLLWVRTFMGHFMLPPHKPPIIYSRKEYLDRKLPVNHSLGSYLLWISRYNDDYNKALPANGWAEWAVWQFTDKGILGSNYPIDLNIFKKQYYQNLLV